MDTSDVRVCRVCRVTRSPRHVKDHDCMHLARPGRPACASRPTQGADRLPAHALRHARPAPAYRNTALVALAIAWLCGIYCVGAKWDTEHVGNKGSAASRDSVTRHSCNPDTEFSPNHPPCRRLCGLSDCPELVLEIIQLNSKSAEKGAAVPFSRVCFLSLIHI